MALPPSIPTSFVPHPASASSGARKFKTDYTGAFGFFGYIALGVVFALALGVFFYGRLLVATKEAKDAELTKAEKAINPATVEGFLRLRDRLNSGHTLLNNHVALSGFFTLFGTLLPTNVRLSSLNLSRDTTNAFTLEGSGVARSFNALAAASTALASDGRIKDIIFSNISISTKDSSVSFSITATLDPKLVVFAP